MHSAHGCSGGGNRRQFLKTAAATGAVLASAESAALAAAPESPVPTVTLGKTGQKVTKLGMGSSWTVAPSFVQAALFAGVRYIDTSESYESGQSEKTLGEVIARTKMRKDVYLVSKCSAYGRGGADPVKVLEPHLNSSLERLQTDYVDAYYLHGLAGKQIKLLADPDVKAAFERLKKAGKIRFCGLSCHDQALPEILEAAAEAGWLDQVMFKYNFRDVDHDALQRAVDKAAKSNLGMVAMKTQGGAISFPDKIKTLEEKGFKKHAAAIKSVFLDDRMQVVVSEMTNREQLQENMTAAVEPLTTKEARLLEEHRQKTANMYCHGCGHLCETAANGVPVATVLRYLRYYTVYGKRQHARELYQALPAEARDLASADLAAAERACPYGLPVADLVQIADRRLG
jgi:uncharacterized protein